MGTQDIIRERAYRLWEKLGRPEGNSLGIWLDAERPYWHEVMRRHAWRAWSSLGRPEGHQLDFWGAAVAQWGHCQWLFDKTWESWSQHDLAMLQCMICCRAGHIPVERKQLYADLSLAVRDISLGVLLRGPTFSDPTGDLFRPIIWPIEVEVASPVTGKEEIWSFSMDDTLAVQIIDLAWQCWNIHNDLAVNS